MATDSQSPAEPALLALAREKFGALSRAEEELFRAAQEGRPASALTGDEKKDDPADAANWKAERVVRANCISWVCTDPHASVLVTHRGLRISGMRIDTILELGNAEIKFPFAALKCVFSENISLLDAQLLQFYLLDCRIKSLNVARARINGSVFLRDGFQAESEVSLVGARIGADLDCSGAQFLNANGLALTANGAKIEGNVFLGKGFKAENEVNLAGSTIGGSLDCTGGAQFANAQGGVALTASGAEIQSSVSLGNGFRAESEVNLRGTTIGGNLDCSGGAQFSNAKGSALSASGAKIEGTVFLSDGFKAQGEVNLVSAKIGRSLDCAGAQLSNVNGLALSASGAKVESTVFLCDGFKAEGELDLTGTTIGGSLDCGGSQLLNAKGSAFSASGAKIQGNVYLRGGFKAEGEVKLLGTTIGGDLSCSGGEFSNANYVALSVERSKIEGHAFLRDQFQAKGEVTLLGATIGSLQIRNVSEAEQTIFDLRLTQVGTFYDDEESWPKVGNLFLDGFRYERLYETAPFEAKSRKKWLSLQPPDRFRPQPYEQLAAVLRQMGHEHDARLITIEKNRERARFTHFPHQGWWWYNLFGKLIGYGYRPWRAFAISMAMILVGTLLFYLGSKHDLIVPTKENAYAKAPETQVIEGNKGSKISEGYPVFNAFFYSLESFTPLLKLDQSANWTPNANRSTEISIFCRQVPISRHVPFPGNFLRYYLYFHIASGWLLTSLWVGAITGLVKT